MATPGINIQSATYAINTKAYPITQEDLYAKPDTFCQKIIHKRLIHYQRDR
jgi:hypothetical protein